MSGVEVFTADHPVCGCPVTWTHEPDTFDGGTSRHNPQTPGPCPTQDGGK